MRYVVLGPVAVTTDAGPVLLERPQRRAVLALLILNANQVISVEQLVEALWGGAPPATARSQLHALIAAVRRSLRDAGAEDAIATQAGGYLLTVADGESDLQQFEALTHRARTCVDPREAGRLLREALRLFTGPPLYGVSAAFVEPVRARLEESRLAAQEQLIEIDLDLGKHRELVAELTALVAEHPLRERLVCQLMVALYRSGRPSEALQAARTLRRQLADDEGLDPGADLQALETAILRADPALAGPSAAAPAAPAPAAPAATLPADLIPRQLPDEVVGLFGRADELAALDAWADADPRPVAAVLTGTPGVGTTAVAVHWAQTRAERFPDGAVLLDGACTPAQAVDEALRAFGVPADDLPTDDREAQDAYQEILATRRAVVVVDDVADAELVRALSPARGASLLLATAATRLDVGTAVPVPPLGADASVRLLETVAGAQRIRQEADAAAMLAQQYGHLPLALLVAGANLLAHPQRSVYQQVAVGGVHLAEGNGTIAAGYAVVDGDLDPADRRLLHLLAHAPGRDVGLAGAATLAGSPADEIESGLRRLTDAYLLTETADGRFSLHPTIRATARAACPPDDVGDALDRLAAGHLLAADHAARLLYPHLTRLPVPGADQPDPASFATPVDALRWLDQERVNLVATIEHATAHGRGATAWLLADTLRGYFSLTMRVSDWRRSAQAALAAAEAYGSADARSAAHLSLAELHLRSSRHPGALRDAWQVLATTGRPQAPAFAVPAEFAARRRRPASRNRVLLALVAVLVLCTSATRPGQPVQASTGAGRVVYEWAVAALRQHEGIDFDEAGRLGNTKAPGMDLGAFASGNHLSGRGGAVLALVPKGQPRSYETCAAIPEASRVDVLRGLHGVADGTRVCLWTAPGRVVQLTLTRAPRLQEPDLVFDYVVWQGTAPESQPAPAVAEGTELLRFPTRLSDSDGINIDAGGGLVPDDDPRTDVSPYGKGRTLRVKTGALIGRLPAGSPRTYTACASLPADRRAVTVTMMDTLKPGEGVCVYSYPGRVALLSIVRHPTADDPALGLDVIIWQGPPRVGPPAGEPAPWVREQYHNDRKPRPATPTAKVPSAPPNKA